MADDEAPSARRRLPQWLRRFLELFVLSGFAVAQPLLDVTGRSPETFLFYRVDGLGVVAYAGLLIFAPPVLLWLVVSLIALASPLAGRTAAAIAAGGLVALVVVQAGKQVSGLRGPALLVTAAVLAVSALVAFFRSLAVRTLLTYLTPAPLVFVLLFLAASPTAELVRPSGGQASASDSGGDAQPPVVIVVLDELPLVSLLDSTGQIDSRVYPNFARLARTSHWFRNGTGVSPLTQHAVPAILTGRYPALEPPSYVAHPDNLFSLLASDYQIRAFETITQLCDPALCEESAPTSSNAGISGLLAQTWGLAMDMAKPYDSREAVSDQFVEETAGEVDRSVTARGLADSGPNWDALKVNQPDRFLRFVKGLRPRGDPTMHFLHLLLPHKPWRYLPSGATYPDTMGSVRRVWGRHAWPVQVYRQRHLLQVAYTDRLLGDVIDRMEKQGIWDDALVVVTADHGMSFVPGTSGRQLIGEARHDAQAAWVPVFIKEPGQSRGAVSDSNWEQVDLLPTVANLLGVEVPFRTDGISQVSGDRDPNVKHFFNYPEEPITFTGQSAFDYVLDGTTDDLVNGSEGMAGLYQTGSRSDWIGVDVSELTSLGVAIDRARSRMTARLATGIDLDAVDPTRGSVPALVTGTLARSSGRGQVVLAVNGTVAAVSQVWRQQGKVMFSGMVNDEFFQRGRNALALYEVVTGDRIRLHPVPVR